MGEGGVKNPEKLPTSFMDGPCVEMNGLETINIYYVSIILDFLWPTVTHQLHQH